MNKSQIMSGRKFAHSNASEKDKRAASQMVNPMTETEERRRQPPTKKNRADGAPPRLTAQEEMEKKFGKGEEGRRKAQAYVKQNVDGFVQSQLNDADSDAKLRAEHAEQSRVSQRFQNNRNQKPQPRAASAAADPYGGVDDATIMGLQDPAQRRGDHEGIDMSGKDINGVMDGIQDNAIDDGKPNPFITKKKSDQVLYAPYDAFSEEKVMFAEKPMPCESNGEILYVNYMYDEKTYGMFMINTPRLFCPGGVMTWEGDKMSALLSLGKDWMEVPNIMRFKNVMDRVEAACVKHIAASGWCGKDVTEEMIKDCMSSIVFVKPDKEANDYPPAIGTNIMTSRSCSTRIMKEPKLIPVPPGAVEPKSSLTSVLMVRWIHKKPQGNVKKFPLRCSFSINIGLAQAVLHAKTNLIPDDVCFVQCDTTQPAVADAMAVDGESKIPVDNSSASGSAGVAGVANSDASSVVAANNSEEDNAVNTDSDEERMLKAAARNQFALTTGDKKEETKIMVDDVKK
ncbi:MAG: hypothetical protein PHN45_00235 [Methylococcales bacterium]|nr:hypothetical protein [Methylococcales bacterium]